MLLFAGCRSEQHRIGHNLFLQDDPAERLYGVLSGTVEVSIYARSGRKLVANIQTGGLIGEIATLDGGSRTASASCFTDCEIVSISRSQMLERLKEHPALAMSMIDLLCKRLRRISGELGDQALLNIEARLAKKLLNLKDTLAASDGWIMISQSDLAELLGATRESVNKTMKDWERDDLIAIRRGALKIRSVEDLLVLANSGAV